VIKKDDRAERMFNLISMAPMGSQTRERFSQMKINNDAEAIWTYLNACIRRKGDVGKSVARSGKISFESIYEDVRQIYEKTAQD
jgi:hypothetical protein